MCASPPWRRAHRFRPHGGPTRPRPRTRSPSGRMICARCHASEGVPTRARSRCTTVPGTAWATPEATAHIAHMPNLYHTPKLRHCQAEDARISVEPNAFHPQPHLARPIRPANQSYLTTQRRFGRGRNRRYPQIPADRADGSRGCPLRSGLSAFICGCLRRWRVPIHGASVMSHL